VVRSQGGTVAELMVGRGSEGRSAGLLEEKDRQFGPAIASAPEHPTLSAEPCGTIPT